MRRVLLVLAVLVVIALGATLTALWHEPTYYAAQLDQAPEQLEQANQEALRQAAALVSAVQRDSRWSATFTAEQINGWLAVDLPKNHPQLLAHGVVDPRVALDEHQLNVACRYRNQQLDTVVSLELDIRMTQEHELAVQIKRLRAGAIPWPLTPLVEGLTQLAQQQNVPLRWTTRDGLPVALVRLRSLGGQQDRLWDFEHVLVRRSGIVLSGQTRRRGGDTQEAVNKNLQR